MPTTTTFTFTGAAQTYVVPAGVTEVIADCYGAQGGSDNATGGTTNPGGLGGRGRSRFPVTPGETLTVQVGGNGQGTVGGYNGGGSAGGGGSGGGATDVRRGGAALANRVAVGGGGGGGGSRAYGAGAGGTGGGTNGQNVGAGGGTQTAGGYPAGGTYPEAGGQAGTAGTSGQGGSAGQLGGAGGGGWFGGGGGGYDAANAQASAPGYSSSGGGGSGYAIGSDALLQNGARLGDGYLILTANRPPTAPGTPTVTPNPVNTTGTVTYTAGSDPDGDAITYDTDLSTDGGATFFNIRQALPETSWSYDFTNVAQTATARLRTRTRDSGTAVSAYSISANFTVAHNAAPQVPTLVAPQNNETVDLAAGYTFQYVYNDPDTGDTQASYAFRRKISGAGAYEYWNAGTAAFQSTELFNNSTLAKGATGNVGFAAAKWTNSNVYNWSVSSRDNGGLTGPYATDLSVTAGQAPSVSVVAPSGTQIATTRPVVTWVYSDQQNDPQATYQVKIFTEAQYSAGGFDPSTSTAVYDSTEIASSTIRSQQPSVDLLNTGVYRAYVRVSQAGPQYSGWAFSGFTLFLTAPVAPTLAVAYEAGTKRLALTVGSQIKPNLLTINQSSLETDTAGWDLGTRSTAFAFDGTASLLYSNTLNGNGQAANNTTTASRVTVVPGQVYTTVMQARGTALAFQVTIVWTDAAGTTTAQVYSPATGINSAGWTQARFTAQAPATAVAARVGYFLSGGAASSAFSVYVDAIGLFSDATGNLVANPDFESGTTGWGAEVNTTIAQTQADSYTGRSSMLVTHASAGNAVSATTTLTGLVAGTVYAISAWVRRAAGTQSVALVVNGSAAFASAPTAWTRLVTTFTATATSHSIFVYNSNASSAAATGTGSAFYLDAVQVVAGSAPVTYLPPTTSNLSPNPLPSRASATGTNYSWSGQDSTTVTQDATLTAPGGGASLKVVQTTAGSGVELYAPAIDGAARATFSFYGRRADGGNLTAIDYGLNNGTGTNLVVVETRSDGWKRYAATAPVRTTGIGMILNIFQSAGAGATWHIANIQAEHGSILTPYVDGSLGAGYGWEASENLISNPSFEVDTVGWEGINKNLLTANQSSLETDTVGWQANGNTTLARSIAQAFDGTASLAMTAMAAGDSGSFLGSTSRSAVVPGQVYTVTAAFRAATISRLVRVNAAFFDGSGTIIGSVILSVDFADNAAGWRQATLTVQAPAGAVAARPGANVYGVAAGEVHYVDAVSLTETPNANLILNPDLDSGTSWWSTAEPNTTHLATTEQSYTGRRSLKVTVTNALSTGYAQIFGLSIVAGTTTTLSGYIFSTVAKTFGIADGANNTKASFAVPANTWTRVSYTGVDFGQFCYFRCDAMAAGSSYYLDAVQLVVGSVALPYLPPATVNLAPRSSAEDNTIGAWGAQGGQSNVTVSTAQSMFGTRSYALTNPAIVPQNGKLSAHNDVRVEPGNRYTLSAYVMAPAGFQFYFGQENISAGGVIRTGTGAWERLTVTETILAPQGTGVLLTVAAGASLPAGSVIYVDGIQVEYGSVATPYVDGSLGAGYSWEASENLLSAAASSFEDGTTGGWSPIGSTASQANSAVTAFTGTKSLAITSTATGAAFAGSPLVSAFPGTTLTASTYARAGSGSLGSFRIAVNGYLNGSFVGQILEGPQSALGVAFTRYAVTVTVPSGMNQVIVTVAWIAAAVGEVLHIDAVQMEQRDYATAYAAPGTAHASTSRRQLPWVLGGTSIEQLLVSTSVPASGTKSLQIRPNGYNFFGTGVPLGAQTIVAVAPSTTYTASMNTNPQSSSSPSFRVVDGTTGRVLAATSPNSASRRDVLTFTTGTTTTSVRVQSYQATQVFATGDAWIDAVQLEQKDHATAFGALGTPNASTSLRQARWVLGGLAGNIYHSAEYSDDSGVTWSALRNAANVRLGFTQETSIFYDYEAPPGIIRLYRARTAVDI